MDLGLDQNSPATGAAPTADERTAQLYLQCGLDADMEPRRPRLRVELAVEDLPFERLRQRRQPILGGESVPTATPDQTDLHS